MLRTFRSCCDASPKWKNWKADTCEGRASEKNLFGDETPPTPLRLLECCIFVFCSLFIYSFFVYRSSQNLSNQLNYSTSRVASCWYHVFSVLLQVMQFLSYVLQLLDCTCTWSESDLSHSCDKSCVVTRDGCSVYNVQYLKLWSRMLYIEILFYLMNSPHLICLH